LGRHQEFGDIPGLIREAREELMEPHTGREVPIGTLEVDEYEFPEHVFDKLLPIEKRLEACLEERPTW
jgi:hypothetical protein